MKKTAAALLAAITLLTGCSRGNTSGEIQLPIYGASAVQYEIAEAKYMDLSETQSIGVIVPDITNEFFAIRMPFILPTPETRW